VKRAGGWILGLVVIAAMAAGGWFALRRVLFAEKVVVVLMRPNGARGPTMDALARGARFALDEAAGRVGRFRVSLVETAPEGSDPPRTVAWIGSTEGLSLKGDWQPAPLEIAAFEVAPWDCPGAYHVTSGLVAQGSDAAAWAKRSNAASVFLVTDESLPSVFIARGFETAAKESGLNVVRKELSTEPSLIDLILAARPDLVFYAGEEAPYGTAFKMFTTLREKGFAGKLVMGEADPEVSFLATRPSLVEGTYLISPFARAPAEIAARMGKVPGPHVTAGYFAMKLALEALERSNSIDDDQLRSTLAKLRPWSPDQRPLRPCALYVARNGLFEFVEELK
jgi:substrate-binding family protein